MEQFTQILRDTTAAIPPEYFLLPIHGGDPVYRERVYCYEFYHQMRRLWPADSLDRLNGEVDKRSHPYFQDGAGNRSRTCSFTSRARARITPSLKSNPH